MSFRRLVVCTDDDQLLFSGVSQTTPTEDDTAIDLVPPRCTLAPPPIACERVVAGEGSRRADGDRDFEAAVRARAEELESGVQSASPSEAPGSGAFPVRPRALPLGTSGVPQLWEHGDNEFDDDDRATSHFQRCG